MIASIADFTTSPGEEIDVEYVLNNPNVSLYTFNEDPKSAVFTELPDGVNLAAVPFVYMAQYEQAQRLIEMDYETFKRIARTLSPVEHLIMIYITGRSGSTLLSHVFNELDNVMSLSEPDVGTQFLHLRHNKTLPDPELSDLLDCTVRVLFRPTPFKTPSIYALKLRSEATQLIDLYQATFPTVRNLYLYRDAVGFVASFYRVFKEEGDADIITFDEIARGLSYITTQDFSSMRSYLEPGTEQVSLSQWLTLWWIKITEWYLDAYARKFPVLAINYADFNRKREATLKAIFDYCGLPSGQVAETLHVFERDSQAGTILARENPTEGNKLKLSDAQIVEIRRMLAQHLVIQTLDYIVPGTPPL